MSGSSWEWISVASYGLAGALMLAATIKEIHQEELARRLRWASLASAWLAISAHAWEVAQGLSEANGPDFSFVKALSMSMMAVNGSLLVTSLVRPMEKLGIVVFPVAAGILAIDAMVFEKSHPLVLRNWQIDLHVATSVLAYSFLNLAALQSLMLALQDWQLRRHPVSRLTQVLPSIQAMENLLFQLIGVGVLLLTVSLISGSLFVHNLLAQHLAHKTVLSVIAWLVFSALLIGRVTFGWRGTTAIRWTLGGFFALALAYFGSKFVLEVILQRV